MYQFLRVVFTFASSMLLVATSQAAEPTIEVSGIQIVRKTYGEGFAGLQPFNTQKAGTSVALMISSPDLSIIKFDMDASTLDAFVDDTRHNLLGVDPKEAGGFGNNEGFGQFPKIAADGKAGMVIISGSGLPASGATKVGVNGTLVAQLGGKSKTTKSDPVELAKGTKIKIDDIEFTVKGIGKPGFGNDPVEVSFQSKSKAMSMLKGVKFFDASGKEIESSSSGSSSMGFLGSFTYGVSYRLKQKLDGKIQIEFEKWTDLKEAKIAISVSAGLGG